MSLDVILDKLQEEVDKPKFKQNIVMDYSSEGETDRVWYSAFSPDDFKSGKFPAPKGKKWNEALDAYIDDAWSNFKSSFDNKADMEEGKLVIYRSMTIKNLDNFLKLLAQGKTEKGYHGLGIFWAWDEDKAESHWGGGGGHEIIIKALVDINHINYTATARKNLNPSMGEDEAEIQLKEHSPVIVTQITSDNKVVWEGKQKIAASLKDKILSKYQIS